MTEAIIVMMNMRGGCATVGDTVHALFRLSGRRRKAEPTAPADAIGNGEDRGDVGRAKEEHAARV